MNILIADQPGTNSYLESLIRAYDKSGNTVICGLHNFFYSNFIPDILHVQWPEKIYGWYPFSTLAEEEKFLSIQRRLAWYKDNNTVIVHTVHNIKPHFPASNLFEEKIFRLIIEYSDILVHHCPKSVDIFNEAYNTASIKTNIICPHGDYLLDFKSMLKKDAKTKLGIPDNKFVILNFGNQLKYKNDKFITSVFKKFSVKEKYLLTAGNNRLADRSKSSKVYHFLKTNLRMKINYKDKMYHYRVISPSELPYYINASDLFFLGHSGNNLNSGILALAATYSKPVVFPEIGCFKEQMEGWVFESYPQGNEEAALKAINNLYLKINKSSQSFDNSEWLKRNSWNLHVQRILSAVEAYYRVPDEH